jgi:alkylation response protein AidB-like acyl-CoA dehydrogenase
MELDDFRAQVRQVLETEVPAALRGKLADSKAHNWGGRKVTFDYPESRTWLDVAVARGWTAPTWPREYGGGGMSRDEAQVLQQEIARLGLPPPLIGFGLTMIGPTLLQFGSERLRREHLPKIAAGQIRWCQGYSEPNAGSDLASLQTSAVREGDHFVLNGQKIWTSYGDQADWMFLLVRTDPAAKKQAGITFLLADMTTPGIEVRPIRLISGASPFCETFFADARVPVDNVVGDRNAGWTVAKALLGHERAMIANVMGSGGRRDGAGGGWDPAEERLAALAREYVGEAGGKLADPVLRDRIAQMTMDTLCFQLTVQRAADGAAAGHRPGAETSMFKLYGTELNQRRQELMVAIRGMQALGWEDGEEGKLYAADEIQQTRDWLRSRGNTIEGGTSEIQLNVLAKQVLGLPD